VPLSLPWITIVWAGLAGHDTDDTKTSCIVYIFRCIHGTWYVTETPKSYSIEMLCLLAAAALALGLTSVFTLVSASPGQLPTGINFTYPGETVDGRSRLIYLSMCLLDMTSIDHTTRGEYHVGVVFPNGTIIDWDLKPWSPWYCEHGIGAAAVQVPGPFPLNGSCVLTLHIVP
jgi:hypothetical protein